MPVEIDRTDWSEVFPILRRMVFLDHAGVSPLSGPAAEALRRYVQQAHEKAYVEAGWGETVEEVRQLAAQLIHARGPHEIAFVANTSSGLAMVARGLDWSPGDNVVTTGVEYPANRYPWQDLARYGVELIEVPQHPDGRVDPEELADAVTNDTRLVAVSHVQFASGYRLDLRPVAEMVHRAGGYLCVDAIQSLGALPVDVQAMGIDFLAADGHKWLLGPEGAGIFYCHEDLAPLLHPAVIGWRNVVDPLDFDHYHFQLASDARRFEAGSYNVAGILALGASLKLLLEVGIEPIARRILELTDYLCRRLEEKGYRVFSPRREEGEKSGIVSFQPAEDRPVEELRRLANQLRQQGFVIAVRGGRLRASPHFYNSFEQLDRFVAALP